jgi:phage shock protein PspC (stress-responsive transcriptional regulator)
MQNNVPAVHSEHAPPASEQPERQAPLVLRNDTILGVCQGIGEEFGFHANWLRVPLAGMVLISPISAFGIYFALGFALLVARLVYPRRVVAAETRDERKQADCPNADNCQEELSAAA